MLAEFPCGLLFCTMPYALFHQGAIWLLIVFSDLLSDCLRAGNSACAGNSIDFCGNLACPQTDARSVKAFVPDFQMGSRVCGLFSGRVTHAGYPQLRSVSKLIVT